ncbi:MAG TPA: adenylate/guanylate cyclase domain-containing protein [Vicinamibacterales bacterium]|nr:adenylate/guanylate cyclase domain-containing protein [Vicinamibacterales bacterium]
MQRAIPLAAALVAGVLGLSDFVHNIELQTYDLRVVGTALPPASGNIALIAIDDESIRRMEPLVGRWPWPRLVHATVIDYLAAAGTRVIAYDVLFAERDMRKFMVGDQEWSGEESDAALVDSTRRAGNVVHIAEAASAGLLDPSRATAPSLDAPALNRPAPDAGCVEPRPLLTPPFPALAQAARAIGHSLFVLDPDGPLRRASPVVQVGDRRIPSFSFATALTAGVIPSIDARVSYDNLCSVMVPWYAMPLSANGAPVLPTYSFYDVFYSQQQVIEGQAPGVNPADFKNRIVIIGATAAALEDVFSTPFRGDVSGPEVHANLVDAMIAGRSIVSTPAWVTIAVIAAMAAVVGLAGALLNAWWTAAVVATVAAIFIWQSVMWFARGIWLPIAVPMLTLLLAFIGDLAWKYFVEGREKRQVKKLFSRYVSKDVYDQLVANPSLAALGGSRRHMTVLFSDIRGFTTMSEKGSPEDVVHQLNQLFARMVAVVFAHRGTLDKFVGDMIMALYGAPLDDDDHAEHAVQTALAMIATLREMNREWAVEGKPQLDIGIGINTGEMIAGNVGSETIMSYTVIGDAVNLGARLESLNKDYGTRIIISEATRQRLKGRYDIHPLGDVIVKGKTAPVAIYEVKSHDA